MPAGAGKCADLGIEALLQGGRRMAKADRQGGAAKRTSVCTEYSKPVGFAPFDETAAEAALGENQSGDFEENDSSKSLDEKRKMLHNLVSLLLTTLWRNGGNDRQFAVPLFNNQQPISVGVWVVATNAQRSRW